MLDSISKVQTFANKQVSYLINYKVKLFSTGKVLINGVILKMDNSYP